MFVLIETNIKKGRKQQIQHEMTLFKYHARIFDSFVIQKGK